MLTPRNANQFTIVNRMTATDGRQGPQPTARIVREQALRLGADGELVGILTHPAPSTAPAARPPGRSKPAFIILNAGVLHRVGPHRLHVVLARRIAATGLAGLRLDLGGIGDSIASSDAASFRESAVADTRAAMTGVTQALGTERFVLFGVCSGADNSIATALVDERIAAVVLVDPPTYPTRRSKLRFLRARIAARGSPREVVRWAAAVAQRRARTVLQRLRQPGGPPAPPEEGREYPPPETFHARLTALVDRGVRVLAVYSGIHGAGYNDPDQLFEVFPALRGKIDRLYFPTANHTFTELDLQAELLDAVTGWVATQFG
jgi:hypothetical protein